MKAGPRYAFAPSPDPLDGMVHRIQIRFHASDGQVWTAGTDTMAASMDSAEDFCDALNLRLGLDREGWTALSIKSSLRIPTACAIPNAALRASAIAHVAVSSPYRGSCARASVPVPAIRPKGCRPQRPVLFQSSIAALRPLRLDRFERRDRLVGHHIDTLQERRLVIRWRTQLGRAGDLDVKCPLRAPPAPSGPPRHQMAAEHPRACRLAHAVVGDGASGKRPSPRRRN